MVIEPSGNRALFKDQASADNYAMRVHGQLRALFFGRRRSDDPQPDDNKGEAGE
jgi:hypothetical protein